jgi:hypothetical protein
MGFVDIKVCAVDETWSGLKLVVRRELRTKERAQSTTKNTKVTKISKPKFLFVIFVIFVV